MLPNVQISFFPPAVLLPQPIKNFVYFFGQIRAILFITCLSFPDDSFRIIKYFSFIRKSKFFTQPAGNVNGYISHNERATKMTLSTGLISCEVSIFKRNMAIKQDKMISTQMFCH